MSEFGTGFALEQSFDFDTTNGTLPTVSGRAIIERDVAFTLAREADVRRGSVPDADFRAEVEVLIRRVLTRDPRITAVRSLSIDLDVGGDAKTAAVDVSVDTVDGETGALLIEI
jgi:hypothetical protein